MVKTIAIAVVLLFCVLGGVGALLFVTYGVSNDPPPRATLPGLSDSAFVSMSTDGSASIRAATETDAYAALGYLHASEHGWSMTLWQRTARGLLTSWFGEPLLPLDRLTRSLGMATLAETAYRDLPETERALLDAYARGANSALSGGPLSGEFSVLDMRPDPWLPWYTLAVDRLFAWLATDLPPLDSLSSAAGDLRTFYAANEQLHDWLHVYGFDAGMAWTQRDSAGTQFTQRHVHGASAVPILQEVALDVTGRPMFAGAALIGTPFFPAGRTDAYAWAILLSGHAIVERAPADSLRSAHERVETPEGREFVLEYRRRNGGLYFDAPPAPQPDSAGAVAPRPQAWVLRWPGLQPVSDAVAWRSLMEGGPVPFEVLEGDGLTVDRSGTERVLGTPLFAERHGGGIAIGNSSWSRYAADRLDSIAVLLDSSPGAAALYDVQSPWAAELAPPLTAAAVSVPDQPALVTDALAYLRNWDYGYDRASIAASIFDTWTQAYRDSLGTLPEPTLPDTALGIHLLRYQILVDAVSNLAEHYGDDPSQWRWEEIQPHRYYFPVWSADTLESVDLSLLARTRYAPIDLPGSGHVSTLAYGPSPLRGGRPAPAQWSGWLSTADWDTFHYRTRRIPANRFFGRYLVSDRAPDPAVIRPAGSAVYSTILLPE